jgi:hypothetical protein
LYAPASISVTVAVHTIPVVRLRNVNNHRTPLSLDASLVIPTLVLRLEASGAL